MKPRRAGASSSVSSPPRSKDSKVTAVTYSAPLGYPNDWIELAIYTHLPDSGAAGTLHTSRNHINVLSADAIVALPGGEGTRSEMWLATQYRVPAVALGAHPEHLPPGIVHARSFDDVRAFLAREAEDFGSPIAGSL
jgi:hypothetical protein